MFLKRSTLVPCHECIYFFHFIFLFEVSIYLLPVLHQEDAKSISKSTFDSPSQWVVGQPQLTPTALLVSRPIVVDKELARRRGTGRVFY